jgi:phosphoribosyl 1,2-cyclic phosphate phosphodiesterase
MKVTFLGSAAAEGWPALFCVCEACREARRRGGPNLRRRTCYLINADTLVDFGPDIAWQCTEFGIDLADIAHLLVTHSHSDHWNSNEIHWRQPGFSHVRGPLAMYANRNVYAVLRHERGFTPEQIGIDATVLTPGDRFQAGPLAGLALEATHCGPDEQALNYILRDDRSGLLITNDSGWWGEATWELAAGAQVDLAIIECTYALGHPTQRDGHLGAEAALDFRDAMIARGVLKPEARVILNHFTHNAGVVSLHEEFCAWAAGRGVEVGFDGLVVEI